ncbi:mitochondrial carrier [Multifurca ochricompacta]|uniref:Mitochondrial carrier n=1 Tax=Multifurca ochricompacta TaxID=376703 RepID=A0AAD4QQC3_9AGAM|nr:mitochondrial carrier [Multifurca ochricompacta]
MEPFQAKLLAAATGSTLTAITMTPFDVVKTRLQTQPPTAQGVPHINAHLSVCCQPTTVPCVRGLPPAVHARSMSTFAHNIPQELVCIWDRGVFRTERVNGFYDAVRHVWRAEGIRGLWKGTGTTLVIGVPSSTAYMLTYDYLLRQVLPAVIPSPPVVPLVAGMFARGIVSSVVSPLELIRTNLQSTPRLPDTPHTLKSVLSSLEGLVRAHGVRHLWRGLGPTLWRDVPFSGFYWASYESMKRYLEDRGRSGPSLAFVCGATSGTAAALLTSPFDVLKTRQQTRVLPLLQQIIRTEGLSALFAGLSPRIAKIAPACGIMIACFEGIGRVLTKNVDHA